MTADWTATSISVLHEDDLAEDRAGALMQRRRFPTRGVVVALIVVFTAAVVLTLGLPSYS